jgi:hypothetical protein
MYGEHYTNELANPEGGLENTMVEVVNLKSRDEKVESHQNNSTGEACTRWHIACNPATQEAQRGSPSKASPWQSERLYLKKIKGKRPKLNTESADDMAQMVVLKHTAEFRPQYCQKI